MDCNSTTVWKNTCVDMIVTLPQYEEYLWRDDIEERRQSWKLIRVGDFKDK